AEDGIRDFHVTGVQTCALPIYEVRIKAQNHDGSPKIVGSMVQAFLSATSAPTLNFYNDSGCAGPGIHGFIAPGTSEGSIWVKTKIGRASCRERVKSGEGAWWGR